MTEPQTIDCGPLAAFDEADLDDVRCAFEHAAPISMRQAWLVKPEPAFAPAVVRTGWRDQSLLVFAELTDTDIFTTATDDNQRFWELGDTFEMFLRPVEQESYVEFHVAPSNLRLQLRFPDAGWIARAAKADVFSLAVMPLNQFQSRTWVHADAHQWCALAVIPAASVCAQPGPLAGAEWRFSCSRYDHTRGRETPVLSSTSPHAAPSFHRQQEWGVLRFQP
jgi:hypothetical protein